MKKNLAISLILRTFVSENPALRNTVKRVDMKRVFMMMMAIMLSLTMFAQQKDVTKFLGIPVDGTVATMKQKLLNKGFKQSTYSKNQLEGRFNNSDVVVQINENNGKVWRVAVLNKNFSDETNIRINFNNLVAQFAKNKKYVPAFGIENYLIPDDTDISFEMTVHKKRFEATFFQMPDDSMPMILSETAKEVLSQRIVWFTIVEDHGQYNIFLFYDNGHNMSHGEDL